ncbi:LacI family DNA-binding transcriptional regulator [Melissococcus plutonius]|uniref:Hexuronate utilization operon transcriptional repressor ExuR n=2 Tax=Melissococcus plutonius TaxID=33970 RepID=F3Y8Y8_MELPT|nr:LacI family DNA-binding transcriptional regulator [Melissococcus plutonius]BAL62628.1 hexuronate utilization operon transcriptional repressor ExuR [Melissococcus plutonius DAT561]AIM24583.1 putative HTH-type transcriptional repressor ExuR [Melissococcus plutonius S1]KMT24664.1 putative HTH-type transcriptional repressor ExuR [Melissococcus plutonius]KMT27377.1 putative HTH-type transcriptional repressor ExuR [Melissococcus plutonius]KMT27550.1 putative HTH-type transcriptional repressor Exu
MVTIKDIAKIAGVSHTTVSRALNNNAKIKPQTRQRIMKIAEDLKYVPNLNAKSLVTNKNYTVGLFFSSIESGTSSSFLANTLKVIYEGLDENYLLSVGAIENITNIDTALRNRFDGILVLSQSDKDDDFIYQAKNLKIPLVVLNRHVEDDSIINIIGDDRQGVKKALQMAYQAGHRKFGLIEGIPNFKSTSERRQGFFDVLSQTDAKLSTQTVKTGDYSTESGKKAMLEILSLKERPDLVFCSNDDMAIGALKACYEQGIKVPDEISLIGFDNIHYSQYTNPSLTTIERPINKMSRLGLSYLVQLMNGESFDQQKQIQLETQVVIRETVKGLN